MSDGTKLSIAPQPAPDRLRRRYAWLRGLRFFDQFFVEGAATMRATAYDALGNPLGDDGPRRGYFAIGR
jgi:hypothetical protein